MKMDKYFVFSFGEDGTMYHEKSGVWSSEKADAELMSEEQASTLAARLDRENKNEYQRIKYGKIKEKS